MPDVDETLHLIVGGGGGGGSWATDQFFEDTIARMGAFNYPESVEYVQPEYTYYDHLPH